MGRSQGCALDETGLVWIWGANAQGELGVGDCEERSLPSPIVELKGCKVEQVQCGGSFSIGVGEKIPIS